ncbi:MAG: hypothetical protein H0X43_12265 [Nitrosospira sp.]|nr:hypothetical protein [Nitrosospira sp.]
MKKIHFSRVFSHLLCAFAFTAVVSASSFAETGSSSTNPSLPPVQTQGQTEFLTGGVGLDESEAILREGNSWPLMLELAQAGSQRGVYIADVQVTIKDGSGNTVLDVNAEGPYLLVKLPPGKYSLEAMYESIKLNRNLNLQEGRNQRMTLLWPVPKNGE